MGALLDLLRRPVAARLGVAGLVAQLTQGAAGLGIILVVQHATGSLARAGVASAAFAAGAAVARPVQGRLVDRRGPRLVLLVSGLLHAAALAALAALTAIAAVPVALFIAAAALAGLGLPPVSACMRLSLGVLTTSTTSTGDRRGDDRTAAYSLVTLTQELAILLGPLLLGVLAAAAAPGPALAVVAVVATSGTLALAGIVAPDATPAAETAAPAELAAARAPMLVLLAMTAALGILLGAVELTAVALAAPHAQPTTAGAMISALSLGGIAGGLLYTTRPWRASLPTRQVLLLALLTLSLIPLLTVPAPAFATVLLLLTGAALNPALTTGALLIDRLTPTRAAEAFGWLSTALAAGTATGSAAAGWAGQHDGVHAIILVGLLAGTATTGLAALLTRLRGAAP